MLILSNNCKIYVAVADPLQYSNKGPGSGEIIMQPKHVNFQ